jgi:hypothetical protein
MRHPQQKLHFHHSIRDNLVKNATTVAKVTHLEQTFWKPGKNAAYIAKVA